MNKKTNECHLVDVAFPISWICLKELEKEEKYIGLAKLLKAWLALTSIKDRGNV